jgi:HK97 family phage prohead protease
MAKKFKTKASKPVSIDVDERTMEVVMSTRDVDRDGDIVETKGIDLKNFLNNPVVLWAHNASLPPIGKILDIVQEDTHMRGTVKFASTEMAEEIFQLYVGGFLKTWSIGFGTKTLDYLKNDDNDVTGYHLQETELFELSAVPVPANPEALVRACKALKDDSLRSELFKAANHEELKEIGTLDVTTGVAKTAMGEEEAKEAELAPSAFEKSSSEIGAAGKIPVTVVSGDKDVGTSITFDVVKREGDIITECKIKEICIVLSQKEATPPLTPQEPSRSDEDDEKEISGSKSVEATADEAMELAAMRKSILVASEFC